MDNYYGFAIRPKTQDATIVNNVFMKDEYGLKQIDIKGVVIDVGGNIGVFARLAVFTGAKHIYSYEANSESYKLLQLNSKDYPIIEPVFGAVWRSDKEEEVAEASFEGDSNETAMSSIFYSGEKKIPTFSLDSIINKHDEIDLLKLDCEGSEYPILYTAQRLRKVRTIIAEYHNQFQGTELEKEFLQYDGIFVAEREDSNA